MGSVSITNGILSASISWTDKDSSGSFTVSATMRNNDSNTNAAGTPRVSASLDNSSWVRVVQTSTLNHGSSVSGSYTFTGTGTGSQTVYVSLLSNYLTGGLRTGTVGGYVDPTPDFSKRVLSISPSTQTMGNTLSISDTSGVGVTSTTHTWTAGNGTGTFSTGSWTIPINTFESLCPNAQSINATFTTYSSGPGGSGSSSKTVTLLVPSDYVPTCTHNSVLINPRNNSLVAGISSLRVELIPSMLPSTNHATVSSTALISVTSSNPAITTSTFTKSGNNYSTSVLPTLSGSPSYTFRLTFRVTDSRGRTTDYTTEQYRVSNFIPPYCLITNLHRDTTTTGTLAVSIISPSAAYSAKVKVSDGTPVDVLNQLVQTQDGYTLDYSITGLSSGEQYPVTFYYKDTNMYNYGEAEYAYSQILSTLHMPLSLYDNGVRLAASFGEECADNYGQDVVINFAKDAYIRFIDGSTAITEKVEKVFALCPFPVGGIYMSVDSTSPSTLWPRTTWTQLQDRFLLGAGSSYTAGATGGEATHTLTLNEIPSHRHDFSIRNNPKFDVEQVSDGKTIRDDNDDDDYHTEYAGGGQAHNNMPPYLVVYMWKRTA